MREGIELTLGKPFIGTDMEPMQSAVMYAGTLGARIQLRSSGFTATFPTEEAVNLYMEMVRDVAVNVTISGEVSVVVTPRSTNA